MIIEQIKATLAMENLHLEEQEEKLLKDYADGLISFDDLQDLLKKLLQKDKAA